MQSSLAIVGTYSAAKSGQLSFVMIPDRKFVLGRRVFSVLSESKSTCFFFSVPDQSSALVYIFKLLNGIKQRRLLLLPLWFAGFDPCSCIHTSCSLRGLDDLHEAATELLEHHALLYDVHLARALRLLGLRHQTGARRLGHLPRHERVR